MTTISPQLKADSYYFNDKHCQEFSIIVDTRDPVLNETDVLIYPNPAFDKLTISIPSFDNEVVIYNMSGEIIGTYETSSSVTSLSIANLSPGMYIISIKNGDSELFFKKFIKL